VTPLYVALEGPHGAGKSTAVDALADALNASGVRALAFHHASPGNVDPWPAALDYARQRAELVARVRVMADPPRVVLCDRWSLSTRVLGRVIGAGCDEGCGLLGFGAAEEWMLRDRRYVILDAPLSVLRERLAARGEQVDPEALAAVREAYRTTASAQAIVDTSRPRAEVLAELVSIVRGWL
jgi:thymidylate kinase